MRNMVLLSAIFGFVFVSGWTGICPVSTAGVVIGEVVPVVTVEVAVPPPDTAAALPALDLALNQPCPQLGPVAL